MFIAYPKIHRLGKDETVGILNGICTIQEKIDGANVSIWTENGQIKCGSRTRELVGDNFNGFVEYVNNHRGIKELFNKYPSVRLYGEWLVKHTIQYNNLAYKQIYLFDIQHVNGTGNFWLQTEVEATAKAFGLNYPQIFGVFNNPTEEQLKEFVGKTNLGEKGEGIVIKNIDFMNQFGDPCYAKIVTQDFKENNALTFGGNNKHSDTYWEMYVVNKYCTLARVQKIINKLQPEINEKLDFKHIPRICQTAYHDLITEEIWEIQEKVVALDFKKLKILASKKLAQIYKDILTNNTDRVTYE